MSETPGAPVHHVLQDTPGHVPPELVYPYNVFEPGPPGSDIFEALYQLKRRAPPIFWTPYNGGHWYTPDGTLARQVLSDPEHFSSQNLMLIREHNPPKGEGFTPIHMDPPEHGVYRQLLLQALSRKTVVELLPKMRAFTIDLIERVKPQGYCDYVADLGDPLPTQVFFYMVDMPETYLDAVRWRVTALHDPAADKAKVFRDLNEIMLPFVRDRVAHPGDDLISWLASQQVDGKPITFEHVHSMSTLLLTAGLGTIADSFGSIIRHLAEHPEDRRWIREHPQSLSVAVDELLRRYPVILAGTARLCVKDQTVGSALVKANDVILATPAMMNFDEQLCENPMKVDFERRTAINNAFGHGPHRCVGVALSRSLLSILLEELLERIPDFSVSSKEPSIPQAGINVCYDHLYLEWPTEKVRAA
jgi:cytochrome P450